MTRRYLVLSPEVFECVVIGIEHKLPMEKVVPPMMDRPNNCVELHIISVISRLWPGEFLAKLGNRSTPLTKNEANADF